MIREATPDDADAIAAFLQDHIETSMFLLSNLERHGIGVSEHAHATRFFLWESGAGLQGVFGCTRGGYLMCQHPGLQGSTAKAYLQCIEGASVQGMTGAADQVGHFIAALAEWEDSWLLNRIEPLLVCDLSKLTASACRLSLAVPEDRALLEDWFERLLLETGMADAHHAPDVAAQRAEAAITDHSTLIYRAEDGIPVGMTSVNASAGKAVQIGGVFILPAFRGQGHAGRMVAAQLAVLRKAGAQTALLFAASDAAAKVYTRIGFRRAGSYRVAMLRAPCAVRTTTCP